MSLRRSSLTFAASFTLLLGCSSPSTEVTKATSDTSAASKVDSAKPTASASGAPSTTAVASASGSPAPSAAPSSQPAAPSPALAEIPANKDGVLADGVADKIVAKNGAPVVVILDPGSEPREPVRYKLAEHKKQSLGMTMDIDMTIGAAGKSMPVHTPTTAVNMDLETAERDPATGDMLVNATITGIKLVGDTPNKAMADKMLEAMSTMKGMKLTNYVSEEGRVRDMKVTMPPGANATGEQLMDQMKQSFTSMSPPLPHDPVGVGAKWRSITRATAGADMLMYTTFTLKSRKGDKIELETEIQQLAASADTTAPNGIALHVDKLVSHGTGKSAMDLTALAPEHGTGDVDLTMDASAQGQNIALQTKVKMVFGPPVR